MEKITRTETIMYSVDWLEGVLISQIREDLDALESIGATHIMIEDTGEENSYVEIIATKERLETDEELATRIKLLAFNEEENLKRDLMIFEKLKARHGW